MPNLASISPELPGIVALLKYKAALGIVLSLLADMLLRGDSKISPGERELIAANVSFQNNCTFCFETHVRVASRLLGIDTEKAKDLIYEDDQDDNPTKMGAMLRLSDAVVCDEESFIAEAVTDAKGLLSDEEIHDVVAISSAFLMFNKYVSTLNPDVPSDEVLDSMGKQLAEKGYLHDTTSQEEQR